MPDKLTVSDIQFHLLQPSPALKDRQKLKAFLLTIFEAEKTLLGGLQCIFCSDDYLLAINQQFLQHNFYTDIITFNLAGKKAPVEGEIYISLDRVRDNAQSLHQYIYLELHRVIFHGVLHLCGYQDKTAKDIVLMRKKEDYYINRYFK